MEAGPILRLAVADDVPMIEAIVRDAYTLYVARMGKRPGPMLDDYAARVGEGGVTVVEAEPDHLLLHAVAVAPALQGRGLGHRPLEHAKAGARLLADSRMHETIALGRHAGYVETGHREEAGFERVSLRKSI